MGKVAAFYQKAILEENSRERLTALLGDGDLANLSDERIQELGALAKELGFDITLQEAREYLCSVDEELSDESLEAVAGGGSRIKCSGGFNCDNINDHSYESR